MKAPPQISTENNLGCPFGDPNGGANEAMAPADLMHRREYRHLSPPPQLSSLGAQNPANSSQPLAIFNSCSAEPYKSTGRKSFGTILENDNLVIETQKGAQGDLGLIMENDAFPNKGSSSVYIPNELSNQDYCSNQVDHQMPTFTDFPIDLVNAWSIDNLNDNSNNYSSLPADSEGFSPWLNLSMGLAGGPALDQEIGVAVDFCDENVRWSSGPVYYSEPFGQGGPLAEALGPNPTSPHDSVSGLGTAVSSPSGVIQRTLFSHSDGSVCNSPLEIGLPRMK
ncbi:growth-regulating factor 1 [Striga asiatica]|uniref:Growth-regulating factor 1 n=1 Tax=Striga asiatica TaxID=4170 RepID=A0A5A7QMX1_STRAF|nr:growth-regulating factor 1 [Striga asiatica]